MKSDKPKLKSVNKDGTITYQTPNGMIVTLSKEASAKVDIDRTFGKVK